ncbi:hypothetical protein CVIRNUC_009131 [Coccomyxa viridis]|uniref:Uncharacterized protein n=1 Tax=Coccomyxa viridis TaxID=1274662 RepID=A0AAV1IF20_9CHLO|nr:hypothetical protein CVIRNUC_009131 [Coccomyxa viridis]
MLQSGSTLICLGISLYLSCNGASAQSLSQAITNMSSATITVMGYNETGFMNTSAYYGPYGDISPDSNSAPKPNVNVDIVPGCNILRNQFAVANYSGPLPCTLPGQGAPSPSAAAGGRRLMQAAFQSSNTSAECVSLRGKVVLITGASTGIGRAAADRVAATGATVIGTSRWPWRYPAPPNWELFQMDQTSDDSVKQLISRVAALYGRIDALYLNAGRQFFGDTPNSDLRQMQLVFETNFWGPVRVFQAALPLFPKTGYARVLVTSSVESQQGSPGYMPYNAAKWSLMAFQEEWVNTHTVNAQTNIHIVTILPGTVNTSLGYTGIFGCPELPGAGVGKQAIESYTQQGLDPHDVGEAAYRLLINPTPPLRNLIMADNQFGQIIPLMCRRYTLPLEEFYVNTPNGPNITAYQNGEPKSHKTFNCSIHCGGQQFCGAGNPGSGTAGTDTIVAY